MNVVDDQEGENFESLEFSGKFMDIYNRFRIIKRKFDLFFLGFI